MSSYEFWDELGKIFNAVVAYQEKNLEFNKRFISPWIRLGNVFEKQDRNQEAMHAYERAVEIDGGNPQNWYELGNIHFKMENFGEAVAAFQRAIELDPTFGWAHSNLALTFAAMGETAQAVTLYQTAIGLLQDAKDKAVAWNRLGNAYRKLNQYENALEAFHRADELDRDNAGFRDNMDDVAGDAAPTEEAVEIKLEDAAEPISESSVGPAMQLNTTDPNAASETGSAASPAQPAEAPDLPMQVPDEVAAIKTQATPEIQESVSDDSADAAADSAEVVATDAALPAAVAEPADVTDAEETVTEVVQESAQTFTATLPFEEVASETLDAPQAPLAVDETLPAAETTDLVTSEEAHPVLPEGPEAQMPAEADAAATDEAHALPMQAVETTEVSAADSLDPAPNSLADQLLEAEPQVLDVAQQVAYEAFLKDTGEPMSGSGTQEEQDTPVELPGSPEPISKIDESGELQIEMDTKNAHVWNELGNVYFNTSAFDDAIVAYSKAIELDRWFAWPYSNLALAYVQKRRFVEAILLYQRSIELFGSDKDKAISWNRLGNVYRRLNDYENAIAAYQRADALDPDNSTLSLQSRFSLLGNYAMEQKPSYVS